MEADCADKLRENGRSTQKQRNPAILRILDPMHRSLLNNNLQYEKGNCSDDKKLSSDSDEYFTAVSTIVSTESVAVEHSSALTKPKSSELFDTVRDSYVKGQMKQAQSTKTDFACSIYDDIDTHDSYESKNRRPKTSLAIENVKQTTEPMQASATENRCDTNYQANSFNGMASAQLQRYPHTKAVRTTNDRIKAAEQSNKLNRRHTKISHENKTHSHHTKPNLCKRTFQPKDNSDSSDINSEKNLVIENMKNRESEMFRKISFNNGYFSTTGSSSDNYVCYTSDTNSIVSLNTKRSCNRCKKPCSHDPSTAKKSPKPISHRKCRSFPLTENHRQRDTETHFRTAIQRNSSEHVINPKSKSKQIVKSDASRNVINQKSRKITITIKTKSVPDCNEQQTQQHQQQQQHQTQSNDNYFGAECESSDESDTTVSDYATLRSESVPICANPSMAYDDSSETNNNHIASNSDGENSDDNSFFSVVSDNEYVSETSQYFNCLSQTDLSQQNNFEKEAHSTSSSDMNKSDNYTEMPKKILKPPKQVVKSKQRSPKPPMICIEQEVSRNRVVTSKIEVDKKQVKEFKRRQKKRSQHIISESEGQFSEVLTYSRQTDISCNQEVIDSIVSSLEADKHAKHKANGKRIESSAISANNEAPKFIDDAFMSKKLIASPKYTGKSINRLLAHRIEQQTITNVRRTLLQNVAYAITEKAKLEKKQIQSLPPIKPPRSFLASASSSPLSKQSFESSATVPIAELMPMGFVVPKSGVQKTAVPAPHVSPASTYFGWIHPEQNVENDEPPTTQFINSDQYSSSMHYYTAPFQEQPSTIAISAVKEDIDTVDGPNSKKVNKDFDLHQSVHTHKDFERFTAELSENRHTINSTPIKNLADAVNSAVFTTPNNASISQIHEQSDPKVCDKCHCHVKEKSSTLLSSKTGKKIGKALKRTKTFMGISKKVKKPSPGKNRHTGVNQEEQESFHTPLKDVDNTVQYNRNISGAVECKKRVNKSLNLTPKDINRNVVELNPSPKRLAERSQVKLLKDAPAEQLIAQNTENDSDVYVTPDEAFNFNQETVVPDEKSKSLKRSPAKMISKLAKSSKKLFRIKHRSDRRPSVDESTHYYQANDYDEVDNKVLLMGEMLSDLRKQIEAGNESCSNIDEEDTERPPSAKKCLFRDRTISTSSADLLEQDALGEQIARIDLHDEPEPLYVEIEQQKSLQIPQATTFLSCIESDDSSKEKSNAPVALQEVYISDQNDSSHPSKYIMVNNNPKILYATVNRNAQLKSTERQTDDPPVENSSLKFNSSYESLDMSLINDFATAMQTELDECQHKINGIFTSVANEDDDESEKRSRKKDGSKSNSNDVQSSSGSGSLTQSDLNSGCSSFYRRSKKIVDSAKNKNPSDFDTLSFDTVGTASYCESISRGNDLNSEIKDTITSLEYLPSELGDLSDVSSRDFGTNNATFKSCAYDLDNSSDSNKFVSFRGAGNYSVESSPSSLYQTLEKNDSPTEKKKPKKLSPNFKFLKNRFRNSLRMDKKKSPMDQSTKFEDCIGNVSLEATDLCEAKSYSSSSNGHPAGDVQRNKLFESIASQIESMPSEMTKGTQLRHLIDKIRQHQEMRKPLQNALEVCRSTNEFHNSRELVEAEELMLISRLKEYSTLEELIALWQNGRATAEEMQEMGNGTLTIKYLEFELKVDSIYDAHFNYFYLCVCSYRDQVEATVAKERSNNRIIFNNLKMPFFNLTADFEIRVEIYALRLRKNARKEKVAEALTSSSCESTSRFRLHGKATLTSSNLSRKQTMSSYHSPPNLQQTTNGKYVHTSYGLISPSIVLCGQGNTLSDTLKIGYQEKIYFDESKANGFLNIADSNQKWDRLWCRVDGFSLNFWKYPQDRNDTESPILTLDLEKCNHRSSTLLVDREICAKPRTFKLDIVNAANADTYQHRRIQSYFISAESQLDLELWLSEIQKRFQIIENWNI